MARQSRWYYLGVIVLAFKLQHGGTIVVGVKTPEHGKVDSVVCWHLCGNGIS